MNRKEIYTKGHTVVITRRFLDKPTGSMRVRVVAYKGISITSDAKVLDEFKDFDDMHAGDTAFIKIINQYSS